MSGDAASTGCVVRQFRDGTAEPALPADLPRQRQFDLLERQDENADSALCEYDGKLSVVNFKGCTLLYTRSNLSPMGGARHVQVAKSADGKSRWSRFEQIKLKGVRFGASHAKNNIYFWTVQRIGRHALLALFPAVLNGKGGVWCSTSTDGMPCNLGC